MIPPRKPAEDVGSAAPWRLLPHVFLALILGCSAPRTEQDASAAGPALPGPDPASAGSGQAEAPLDVPAAAVTGGFTLAPVSVPAHGDAALPSLARGGDGIVRISWVERGEDGSTKLVLSPFEEGGFHERIEVARGTSWFVNWADFPCTSALSDGTLVAAWLERNGEGTYAYGVNFSLSHDAGTTWTEPRWLHEDRSASEHGFVSIAPLDDGRFLAIWLDGRNTSAARGASGGHGHGGADAGAGAQELWSRTIARDGTLGPELRVDDRVCDCCQTSLVRAADGALVAAWRDRSEEEVRDIHFARFDGQGWSEGAVVHPDGWLIPGCPVNGPRLARSAKGIACVWHTGGERSGTYTAFSSSDADSKNKSMRFGMARRVDDGSSEGRVDACALDGGRLLATWMEHAEDGVEWRARVYEADGRAGESITIAPTSSERKTGFLRMQASEGGALLAWTDTDAGTLRVVRLEPAR